MHLPTPLRMKYYKKKDVQYRHCTLSHSKIKHTKYIGILLLLTHKKKTDKFFFNLSTIWLTFNYSGTPASVAFAAFSACDP